MDEIHVVFTEYPGYGWSFDSPQVPGLINMFASAGDAQAALDDALLTAGVEPGTAKIWLHEQKFFTDAKENEYLVRFGLSDAGFDAASRIVTSIQTGTIEPSKMPVNPAGDRLVIGVDASETLGWIDAQLRENESVLVVYHAGADVVYHMPYGETTGVVNGWRLNDLGVTVDSTIKQVLDAVLAHEAAGLDTHDAPAAGVQRKLTPA